jgi:hypothetical protein
MLGFDICNLLDKLIGKKNNLKLIKKSIEFLPKLLKPFKAQIFVEDNKN